MYENKPIQDYQNMDMNRRYMHIHKICTERSMYQSSQTQNKPWIVPTTSYYLQSSLQLPVGMIKL